VDEKARTTAVSHAPIRAPRGGVHITVESGPGCSVSGLGGLLQAVGKSKREALQVLKRRLVRVVFNLLHADLDQAQLD
jgi:hypothetical protein